MVLNQLQNFDLKWIITTLLALGVFAIEIWTRIIRPYKDEKALKKSGKLDQLTKEKNSYVSLKGALKGCIENLENNITYTDSINISLINFPNKHATLNENIEHYNKYASHLRDLSKGCEYYVNTLVTKNVLMHLPDINSAPNKNISHIWQLGSINDGNLGSLISRVLKDKIVSGETIDKPLFDRLNPLFWKEISEIGCGENFNRFIANLNSDIGYQRDYGMLKAFSEMKNEMKILTEELIRNVDKEIELIEQSIDEL
jgi:hypothetical protein